MKLIEKLAREYAAETVEQGHSDPEDAALNGFWEGFNKAREMAEMAAARQSPGGFVADPLMMNILDAIRELGEEEVGG